MNIVKQCTMNCSTRYTSENQESCGDCIDVDDDIVTAYFDKSTHCILPITSLHQLQPFQLTRSDTLMEILGRPNFACGEIADALRKKGHEIPEKAENEQAEVLFWMTNLFLKHGEKWVDEGEKYFDIEDDKQEENKGDQA